MYQEIMLNCLNEWPSNIDYIMFIDENNSASSLNIVKDKIINNQNITPNENIFTVTGCIFKKEEYKKISKEIDYLKNKYWENGKYLNKKGILETVCLHTEEIKSRKNAFHKNIISDNNLEQFIQELDKTLEKTNYKIITINIVIDEFIKHSTYKNINIYNVAFNFIIERFIYCTNRMDKLAVVFEARGKREDKELLNHISTILNIEGTEFIKTKKLKDRINGIYFNKKRNANGQPYTGLEIADLSSYPIHRYVKFGKEGKDYKTIKKKIVGYPDSNGKGFKIYPQKNKDRF